MRQHNRSDRKKQKAGLKIKPLLFLFHAFPSVRHIKAPRLPSSESALWGWGCSVSALGAAWLFVPGSAAGPAWSGRPENRHYLGEKLAFFVLDPWCLTNVFMNEYFFPWPSHGPVWRPDSAQDWNRLLMGDHQIYLDPVPQKHICVHLFYSSTAIL